MRKSWIFIVLVAVTGGFLGYSYLYKDHRDVEAEAPTFEVEAVAMVREFSEDLGNAESKYLNKVIAVEGIVTETDGKGMTLSEAVYVTFDAEVPEVTLNSKLKVKGRCIGYDELLEIIKLDQTNIIE